MSSKKLTSGLLIAAVTICALAYLHAAPTHTPTAATPEATALLPSWEQGGQAPAAAPALDRDAPTNGTAESVTVDLPCRAEAPSEGGWLTRVIVLVFGAGAALGAIRAIQDVRDNRSIAIPAAGATADSDSIFIGTGPHVEELEAQVVIPALPDLVDAKTVIVTLQDSSDDAGFSAITELATVTSLGAGGVGAAASTTNFRLPSSFRGYLRAHVATLSAAGDNTAVSVQLNLLQ